MSRNYRHNTRISFRLFQYDRIDYDSAKVPTQRHWVFHFSLLTLSVEYHDFIHINPVFEIINQDDRFYVKLFCFKYSKEKGKK
jgi:hypothetical protein